MSLINNKILILIISVTIIILAGFGFAGEVLADPGWLSGYNYRKQVTVTNASADYQTKVLIGKTSAAVGEDVDCGGHIADDFDDLRFTKTDGETLLPYWIESIVDSGGTKLATVWVKNTDGESTLYMYYGGTETAVSSGANTFRAFEDFTGALNSHIFTVVGSHIVHDTTNNWLDVQGMTINETSYAYYDLGADSIGDFKLYVTAQMSGRNLGSSYEQLGMGVANNLTQKNGNPQTYIGAWFIPALWYQYSEVLQTINVVDTSGASTTMTSGTLYYYTLTRVGAVASLKSYSNSARTTQVGSTSSITCTTAPVRYLMAIISLDADLDQYTTNPSYVTNIILMKYAATEPTFAWGSEEIAPNWLSGWSYRKQVTVTNASASYQTKILVGESAGATGEEVDCNSHVQTDFDDLRFTGSNGTTLLNYWIESITGTTPNQLATVWVQNDATSSATCYMYYGNSGASSASNGPNTFIFFDDFETYEVNSQINGQNGWTSSQAPANMLVQNDYASHGSKSLRGYAPDADNRPNAYKTIDPAANYDVLAQYSVRTTKPTTRTYDWTLHALRDGSLIAGYFSFWRHYNTPPEPGGDKYIAYYDGAQNTLITYSVNTWYNVKVWLKMSTKKMNIWVDDVLKKTDVNWSNTSATKLDNFYTEVYAGWEGYQYSWIDDIRIRKYVSPEPIWGSWGSEEHSGYFISTNLLTGVSPAPTSIDSFVYNLSDKPSGTTATVGFNQNGGSTWYNAAGVEGTETLVTGSNQTITLTGGWSGANFYYKVTFTSDGTSTPVLDDITVNYTSNAAPTVDSVSLNGGSNITLSENTTKSVSATGTVSDANGYANITSVIGKIYRSGVGSDCSADNNNCYSAASCATSSCASNDCVATCSYNVQFYADPTDTGTYSTAQGWNAQTWVAWIKAIDASNASSSATNFAQTVDVNTLTAINVDSSINYDALNPNTNMANLTKALNATTTGNVPIDVQLKGDNMTYGATGTITVANQKYATSTVAWASGIALDGTYVSFDVDMGKPTASPSTSTDIIYWGWAVPSGTPSGNYTGTNYFNAVEAVASCPGTSVSNCVATLCDYPSPPGTCGYPCDAGCGWCSACDCWCPAQRACKTDCGRP